MFSLIGLLFGLHAGDVAMVDAEAPEASRVFNVTSHASEHRTWRDTGITVYLSNDVQHCLVDWTDDDSERVGIELDEDDRIDTLLAQAAFATKRVMSGERDAMFLAEYYDREKRGNPRRARLVIRQVTDSTGVIHFIEFA